MNTLDTGLPFPQPLTSAQLDALPALCLASLGAALLAVGVATIDAWWGGR